VKGGQYGFAARTGNAVQQHFLEAYKLKQSRSKSTVGVMIFDPTLMYRHLKMVLSPGYHPLPIKHILAF
jgi:hypothetical protein